MLTYFLDIGHIDQVLFTKPMLAETYASVTFPVLSQPKLDGMRCIARADGLWSRTGKQITTVPHVIESLEAVFRKYPDLILDGELYNPELKDDFGTLMSLARGGDPDGRLQYHVYDVPSDTTSRVEQRLQEGFLMLEDNIGVVQMVDTHLVKTQEELDRINSEYLAAGYEGQMVRIVGSLYENKRSKNLLKRKEFLTDEFPVISVLAGEGNWAGYAKKFVVRLADGRECGAGVRGDQAKLSALLKSVAKPLWATVRYFTPTPDGVPRFPVVIDWGFEEKRSD